jgi:hypothetical protein
MHKFLPENVKQREVLGTGGRIICGYEELGYKGLTVVHSAINLWIP